MTDWTLKKLRDFPGVKGPVVAVVMDGVGCGGHDEGDAVWLARKPNLNFLASQPATALLRAHGTAVGMPSDADMGNSEVGHNALGAGRTFDQGAKLVDQAIRGGAMFEGDTWRALSERARGSGQPLHFIGLLSDGNVHSHIDHLLAMLRRCHQEQVPQARVHILLDGRDVPETSALEYIEQLESLLRELQQEGRDYRIASGGGRMTTTMDRYGADWSMVERGYQVHVHGQGRGFGSAREAVETFRRESPGVIDQDLPSFVVVDAAGQPVGAIRDGATVVCFNFRGDRALELTEAFEADAFYHFDRGQRPDVLYAGMMEYDADQKQPAHFLVQPPEIDETLGEYLVHNQVFQLACSETQKFGHVTYFWNGNRSGMFDDKWERYIEVPSDRVPFEQRPWMKAAEITDAVIAQLSTGGIRHARINYANGDMVGHTGKLDAAVIAVEVVDLQLGRLIRAIDKLEGALIVTADHGNADQMFELDAKTGDYKLDEAGRRRSKTSHTLNRVPMYVYAPGLSTLAIDPGVQGPTLSNVASTILQLLGYQRPHSFEPGLLRL